MAIVRSLVAVFCLKVCFVNADVLLEPFGNVTVCANGVLTLTCVTTQKAALVWFSQSASINHFFSKSAQQMVTEGNFILAVNSVEEHMNGSIIINSTAAVSNFTQKLNNTLIRCSEFTTQNYKEAELIIAGPPNSPAAVNISKLSDTQSSATFTISWNHSDCAVYYVLTVINSPNDRVYSNITTSDTSATVTLPTGVEFCVTLAAVDNIGRRGPDTAMPICYYYDHLSTVSPSPTVTHSPVMEGPRGVNVAVAVAIPIIILLIVLVIGITVMVLAARRIQKRKDIGTDLKLNEDFEENIITGNIRNYICQVFYYRLRQNQWKINCAFFPKEYLEKVYELYQDANQGEKFDFEFTNKDLEKIEVFNDALNSHEWIVTITNNSEKVSAAAVRSYAGAEKPPFCEMLLKPQTIKFTPSSEWYVRPKGSVIFLASVTGIEPSKEVKISRAVEPIQSHKNTRIVMSGDHDHNFLCQVFYYKETYGWKVTFAFFLEEKMKEVKTFYQGANVGNKAVNIKFKDRNVSLTGVATELEEWKVKLDTGRPVTWNEVMAYVIGKPPSREITFITKQREQATFPSLDLTVFINEETQIQIKRAEMQKT